MFLLVGCTQAVGKQDKISQNLSPNSFALQQQFRFQQPIYPKPSFVRYEVSLPLASPQGISWAITSCLHLEPRTHRKIYSWANIWKLHQLCPNIYVHAYIVKDCISYKRKRYRQIKEVSVTKESDENHQAVWRLDKWLPSCEPHSCSDHNTVTSLLTSLNAILHSLRREILYSASFIIRKKTIVSFPSQINLVYLEGE